MNKKLLLLIVYFFNIHLTYAIFVKKKAHISLAFTCGPDVLIFQTNGH